MVAVHERLYQDEPGGVGRVVRLLGLGRVAGVRLLAEHVLAGLEGAHRPRVVHPVRQRDVDGVDVRVLEQRLVRAVRLRDPVLARVRLRLRPVTASDGDDVDLARLRGAGKDLPVDVGGGEKAEPHRRSLTSRSAGYSAR